MKRVSVLRLGLERLHASLDNTGTQQLSAMSRAFGKLSGESELHDSLERHSSVDCYDTRDSSDTKRYSSGQDFSWPGIA